MLSYTAYKRSFSTLISVMHENKELKEKAEVLGEKSQNIEALKADIDGLNKALGKEVKDKEKVQQDIIGLVPQYAKNASITDLRPIHEYNDENHNIYTNRLDVTGSLDDLLELSYNFERKYEFSRMVSMNLYTVKRNNNPDALHLKMIFQHYENNN